MVPANTEHHLSWHELPGRWPLRNNCQRSWRRYFGTPDVMIRDGGLEFRGDFAQSGDHAGILQIVVDADAPWQKGERKRHGGLVQDLLAKGLETEVVFQA